VTQRESNEVRLASMEDDELLDLMNRLTAFTVNYLKGRRWRNGSGEVLPNGEDSQSLVQTALGKLLAGAKWDEDKPAWLVLQGIIKGRVQSLVNSPENKKLIDCNEQIFAEPFEDDFTDSLVDEVTTPLDEILEKESQDRIFSIIEELENLGKVEECQIVEAIFCGNIKRADILKDTELDDNDYDAAKKRLRRFLENFRQKMATSHH